MSEPGCPDPLVESPIQERLAALAAAGESAGGIPVQVGLIYEAADAAYPNAKGRVVPADAFLRLLCIIARQDETALHTGLFAMSTVELRALGALCEPGDVCDTDMSEAYPIDSIPHPTDPQPTELFVQRLPLPAPHRP